MSPLTPRQALLLQPARKQPHRLPRKPQGHRGLVPANKTLTDALSPGVSPGVPRGHPSLLSPSWDPLGVCGSWGAWWAPRAMPLGGWSLGKGPAGTGCPHSHGDVPHQPGGGISLKWLRFSRQLPQGHSPPPRARIAAWSKASPCFLRHCCGGDTAVLLHPPAGLQTPSRGGRAANPRSSRPLPRFWGSPPPVPAVPLPGARW